MRCGTWDRFGRGGFCGNLGRGAGQGKDFVVVRVEDSQIWVLETCCGDWTLLGMMSCWLVVVLVVQWGVWVCECVWYISIACSVDTFTALSLRKLPLRLQIRWSSMIGKE